MTGGERRRAILDALREADAPESGSALARRFGVSRQVIVQDVALLRADGAQIASTNRGYRLLEGRKRPCRLFKVHHEPSEVADEMTAIVDLGGTVEDTIVNHRRYGIMRAPLGVASRRDVERFVDDLASSRSSLLSGTTSGYHFHHVSAEREEDLDAIEAMLAERGWLVEMSAYERENIR